MYLMGKYKKYSFVIWGAGKYLKSISYMINPQINICTVVDSDKNKWGKKIGIGDKSFVCQNPADIHIKEDMVVLVAVQSQEVLSTVKEKLSARKVVVLHINEFLKEYMPLYEKEQIGLYDETMQNIDEDINYNLIKCFITISVPIDFCNLQCEYCYVGQNNGFHKKEIMYHSPGFIRKALSRKRIGGTAFINLCGTGETFLCRELVPIIKELLNEGHYISIITNALVMPEIDKLLKNEYVDHLFFKCSFHYIELKKKGLLSLFSNNVNRMRRCGASVSVEMVPYDDLIPLIDEIKEYSIREFGALPHLTVARDEREESLPLLTGLSEKEYDETWSVFDSDMFTYKLKKREKQEGYCIAGKGTFLLHLDTGSAYYCPQNKNVANIYENIFKPIDIEAIGYGCESPYCINAHAYLTLGMVETENEYSYLDIRDRECKDGSHWVKESMAYIMKQRICDNLKGDKA